MSDFSIRLKWLREKNKLTQKEMAEKLNITQSYYSKFEYGQREPNIETLAKLPTILGESIDFLIGVRPFDNYGYTLCSELNTSIAKIDLIDDQIKMLMTDPNDKSLEHLPINPKDPSSVNEYITNYLNVARKDWTRRGDICREKLLKYLDLVPWSTEEIKLKVSNASSLIDVIEFYS